MSFGTEIVSIANAAVGQAYPHDKLVREKIDEINGADKDSTLEGKIREMFDELHEQIPDRSELNGLLQRIAAGIGDAVTKELFADIVKTKSEALQAVDNRMRRDPGGSASSDGKVAKRPAGPAVMGKGKGVGALPANPGAPGVGVAGGADEARRGRYTPEHIDELRQIKEDERGINNQLVAENSAAEAIARRQSEATTQAHAAEDKQRSNQSYFESARQGLDSIKQHLDDGWRQIKLFDDEIAKKVDYGRFMMDQAQHEARRWYMNWLWISIGNTKNNMRKILSFLIARLCIADAAAIRETRGSSPQLELGSLDNVTQPPDGSYRAALNANKELEGMQSKRETEVERLQEKGQKDVPEYKQKMADYQKKADDESQKAKVERGLSEEAQQALAMSRERSRQLREKYDLDEKKMEEIRNQAGIDPQNA